MRYRLVAIFSTFCVVVLTVFLCEFLYFGSFKDQDRNIDMLKLTKLPPMPLCASYLQSRDPIYQDSGIRIPLGMRNYNQEDFIYAK